MTFFSKLGLLQLLREFLKSVIEYVGQMKPFKCLGCIKGYVCKCFGKSYPLTKLY